jgi:hypothetical protein
MSSIGSSVGEIENLRIDCMPSGRVMRGATVVRCDDVIVVVPAKAERIYSPNISNHVHYAIGVWPWTEAMMKALWRMGIISKQAMDTHTSHVAELEKARESMADLDRMERYARKYGFELTSEQVEAMKCEPAN